MRRIARYVFYVLFCLITTVAIGQTKKVTGKIVDQNGQAVPGASVLFKGTQKGSIADDNGVFSVDIAPGDVLVVSASGYSNNQIKVTAKSDLSIITLSKSNKVLEEVVVTAIGITKSRAKLGYAASTYNSEVVNKNGAVSALDGLEGKVAGAEISDIGGPGVSSKVILRGYGIIAGGNNQPLYVIDGVPLADPEYGNADPLSGGTDFGDGMTSVNPNDIESITVLKGTAAASLYGSIAKNGAILITTKKGRAGKLKVEYDGSADISLVGKLPDYQTEFGQGWGGQFNLDENGSWGPKLDGKERLWGSVVDNSQLIKPFSSIPNNLRNFYETGSDISNNIALSGGNENNRFYFSYSNVFSNGVVPTHVDDLERHTFSLRTNSTYGNFSINTSFNYVYRNLNVPNTGQNNNSQGGGVFQSILQIPVDLPIADFRDYTNKFFNVDNYFTPYAENPYYGLNENGDNQKSDRFFGNLDLNYKFNHAFSAEYRLGGDFTNARTFDWNQPNGPAPDSWRAGANPEGFPATPDVGSVTQGSDYYGVINMDGLLKYNQDITKKINLDVIGGANFYQVTSRSEYGFISNLIIPGFFNLSNSAQRPTATDGQSLFRNMGVYGSATLGFNNELYLTGNARNDWSSALPTSLDHVFYPGGNLSWIVSKTLGLSENGVLSFLKLRAAYGKTGSVPEPYQVYSILVPGTVGLPFGSLTSPFNGTSAFGISNTIYSPNLQPIITKEFETGLEARLFGDRVGIDASYYYKRTIGQIFDVPIASSTGYTGLVENLGQISNKGVELTLNIKPIETKDFSWNLTYTYTRNWNNVDNLTGSADQHPEIFGITSGSSVVEERAVVGKTVASIYATTPELSPTGQTVVDAVTGLPVQNETALDKYGNPNKYFGSGLYNYTMGLTNTFTYKSFQLSGSLDFRYGGVMYSSTADLVLFDGNGIATTYNDRKPFVIPNSVNATTDGSGNTTYTKNNTYIGNTSPYNGETDDTYAYYYPGQSPTSIGMRIFDRSFLKLRDINLSYTLPGSVAKRIKANSLSIGIYGRNFLLWTPTANKYVDPEGSNFGNDLTSQLGEFSTEPLSKQYGLILKATF